MENNKILQRIKETLIADKARFYGAKDPIDELKRLVENYVKKEQEITGRRFNEVEKELGAIPDATEDDWAGYYQNIQYLDDEYGYLSHVEQLGSTVGWVGGRIANPTS